MSYYSQPAAANYNTSPMHAQRQRGYRICDQCGTPETPSVKFRLCGGCVSHSSLYPSPAGSTDALSIIIDGHPILLARLPEGSLALTQGDLPTHRRSDLQGWLSNVERLCRRASRQEPPKIHLRSHLIARMGRVPGSPAQASSGERTTKRTARGVELS